MKKTVLLLSLVIALAVLPFFINHGGAYSGSDNAAKTAIQQLAPDYKPWFTSFFKPASSEIESRMSFSYNDSSAENSHDVPENSVAQNDTK